MNAILFAEPLIILQRDYLLDILQEIISEFNRLRKGHRISTLREEKNEQLSTDGLVSFEACYTAFNKLLDLFKKEPVSTFAFVSDIKLFSAIAFQINPAVTLPARMKSMLPARADNLVELGSSSVAATSPEFPEPMYRSLAEQSIDFILPGLSEIPPNKVALLRANQPFIESYMVGIESRNVKRISMARISGAAQWHFIQTVLGCQEQSRRSKQPGTL